MTTTLQELKPTQIKPHKNNPRHDVGDVTELAASIKEQGVLEPLLVAPNGTGATFVLLAGHRRLAAAKAAKCKTVPCIVRDDLTDPQRQLETMLVENLQRSDLSAVEEAEAYQQLLEFPGYTQKRITEATGRATATVRARLKLAKLPDATRAKVHSGQISLTDAQAIAEFSDDDDAVKKLAAAVGSYNFNWTLERLRRDRDAARKETAARRQLEKDGVRVFTSEELEELEGSSEGSSEPFAFVSSPDSPYYEIGVDLPIDPAEHTSCPGHAATIQRGDVLYVCVEPTRHADLLETSDEVPDDARRARDAHAAEQAEAARVRDDLAVAAKVRRKHLAEAALGVGAEYAASILREQILHQASDYYADAIADVVIPDHDEAVVDGKKRREAIAAALGRIHSLEHLAALLDVASHVASEQTLARPWGWPAGGNPYNAKETRAWRDRLVDIWGYEYSDVERSMLDTSDSGDPT